MSIKNSLNPESANFYANGKVIERAGSPKPSGVRIRSPPGGISSIKFGWSFNSLIIYPISKQFDISIKSQAGLKDWIVIQYEP